MRIGYANVTSTLALVVALSGTAYAAVQLNDGQVKTRHLADGAVTTAKLHGNAVTTGKVDNGTLKTADFASSQLPAPAYHAENTWNTKTDYPAYGTPVHALSVPTGNYVVSGRLEVDNASAASESLICDLYVDLDGVGRHSQHVAAGQIGAVTFTAAVTLSEAGSINMRCTRDGSDPAVDVRASSLTAIKVPTLTTE